MCAGRVHRHIHVILSRSMTGSFHTTHFSGIFGKITTPPPVVAVAREMAQVLPTNAGNDHTFQPPSLDGSASSGSLQQVHGPFCWQLWSQGRGRQPRLYTSNSKEPNIATAKHSQALRRIARPLSGSQVPWFLSGRSAKGLEALRDCLGFLLGPARPAGTFVAVEGLAPGTCGLAQLTTATVNTIWQGCKACVRICFQISVAASCGSLRNKQRSGENDVLS